MLRFKKVIVYAGTFIAFLIGPGFATGQEILQYFVAYGYWGMFSVLLVFLLLLYVGSSFISVGQKRQFQSPNEIFGYYCGKKIGLFFDYFSVLFIYMSFFVMIAGAGANLQQQFGLPVYAGGVGLGLLTMITVIFGLNKIVKILGIIGPLLAVLAIALGAISLSRNATGLTQAAQIVPELGLIRASINWFFSAGSYVGFCMLWLAAFLSSMGKSAASKKEACFSAAIGAAGFSIAVLVTALALLASVETVAGSQVPMLTLAGSFHPTLALVFSIVVLLGIYTTAVPLLWAAASKIAREGTTKFRVAVAVLGTLGIGIGLLLPFDRLVNLIYVLNGYVGTALLVFMIIKDTRSLLFKKKRGQV